MRAELRVGDGDEYDELLSLRDWLTREPEFRGRVHIAGPAVRPGEMGATGDVLMVALGGGGAVTVLAGSVKVWLRQRRSGLAVTITDPDGARIEIVAEGPAADRIARGLGGPPSTKSG